MPGIGAARRIGPVNILNLFATKAELHHQLWPSAHSSSDQYLIHVGPVTALKALYTHRLFPTKHHLITRLEHRVTLYTHAKNLLSIHGSTNCQDGR